MVQKPTSACLSLISCEPRTRTSSDVLVRRTAETESKDSCHETELCTQCPALAIRFSSASLRH